MPDKLNREDCLNALVTKASQESRLPKKADFTEEEVARIKAFLGPWPRALEAAGLTPSKEKERYEKNRDKRTKTKRKK